MVDEARNQDIDLLCFARGSLNSRSPALSRSYTLFTIFKSVPKNEH
jgi:hypothetical protein